MGQDHLPDECSPPNAVIEKKVTSMSADTETSEPVSEVVDGYIRQNSPVHMFKTKHLFVELHEFRRDHWHETHRWNHGLQEDLVVRERRAATKMVDSHHETKGSWTKPHLPSVSLNGLANLRNGLMPCTVVLDLYATDEHSAFNEITKVMMEQFVRVGLVDAKEKEKALAQWMDRLFPTKCVVAKSCTDESLAMPRNVSIDSALSMTDPLKADADEEAVHILVDEANWLRSDVVAFVRLANVVNCGLEEQSMWQMPCCKYIAFILGPPDAEEPMKRVEMGRALAALLQDDCVVNAAYNSSIPDEFVEMVDDHFTKLRLMPQTSRPTQTGIAKRAQKMFEEFSNLKSAPSVSALLRTQTGKWAHKQRGVFDQGVSVGSIIHMMQRFAIPLLTGILVALIWANTDPVSYDKWAGYGPAYDAGGTDGSHRRLGGGGGGHRPTILEISIHGHPMTLHFLVNDIGMCLFFGLAAKEIAEALQPGGSLFPPTRTTVNVLAATLGGVFGPIIVYLISLGFFDAVGLLDDRFSFGDYAIGWGVPTATDISIAWVTALLVFGSGHPAINYLLLLAVVDDGIGLLIIAFAYPDPANPLQPQWLLLVIVAMGIAFLLRRLKCSRWQAYILLAGPVSWIGLLYAALHPSLALVFIVPFMPLKIENDSFDISSAWDSEPENSETKDQAHKHHAPLHDFEEACKGFVDFGVLFAFGAVNAGVKVDSVGVLTLAILLALVVGKTLGIFVAAKIATACHCPPPAGMTNGGILIVGFIASAGLTVSLFMSGQAFSESVVLGAEAKMGALMSIFSAFIALAASAFVKKCCPELLARTSVASASEVTAMHNGDSDEDMFLEDVIVENTVRNLRVIHKAEAAVEKKAKMNRKNALTKMKTRASLDTFASDPGAPKIAHSVQPVGKLNSQQSSRSLPAHLDAATIKHNSDSPQSEASLSSPPMAKPHGTPPTVCVVPAHQQTLRVLHL
eukprot:TRINITY_DN16861_c0_g1_i1.p1 TRINITY_DN16861_c0_g1~~TRINITY_DN16861_c0_g1_i1.p1  ORF type:complete len:967 (-),score=177.36 TRINITY_DN16861_c0_g1_i1:213-3113(-)